ncbi:Protein of unknown function [Saccharicrinis carchari]|uniref:Lipopolysaccharide assembly protein A domain-containing protein n=1 Tax=Saccharicrinis carchari TaxID=1168039 RepID=A0A521E491_SACCC|nr:LapA family protein [Saccharicrinis carchari]SMO78672.1 Protein of unknown function [Saccharicrinis carchari]
MKKSFWILMILAVFVVVFSVQNADPVSFSMLMWRGELSLAILLICSFIIGAVVGALYYGIAMRQKKKNKMEDESGDIPFEKEGRSIKDDGI